MQDYVADLFLIVHMLGMKDFTAYTKTKERQWSCQQWEAPGALFTLPSWQGQEGHLHVDNTPHASAY